MMKSIIITSIYASSMLVSSVAMAGLLKINNENDKKLTIRIIPEEAKSSTIYKRDLPAKGQLDLNVTPADINNKSYYSLEGETHPFIGDTCKHLNVSEDYDVTFQDDKVGTTCLAKPIK